ncbi:CMD domain protein [Microbacterium sp. NPDC057407]|uniref:CMD domain protein n=1 Tax=Microbacterium sp. NPDC057407 TaxID=3346120 RepID=UPI0036712C47
MTSPDTLDRLADVRPAGAIDELRRRRPVTRDQLQASYDALFAPVDDSEFPVAERTLVAAFATRVTADDATAAYYAGLAREADAARAETVLAEASAAATAGPFGTYVEAGLQDENSDGRRYEPPTAVRETLGERLAAAIAHAHLLTARPREAGSAALDRLLEAGWSVDGIVTLSQLISFLAFQQRVAAGLRVLAQAAPAPTEEVPA